MSCYNPKIMRARVDSDTGALNYVFERYGGKYTKPAKLLQYADLDKNGQYEFYVPCGKCLGCRMDYTKQWADRMVLELQDNPKALMITLTYDNEHLPRASDGTPTLLKSDAQKWLKRLRKHLYPLRIRYYLCGEYGTRSERPHYHAILYGISPDDIPDLRIHGKNKLGDMIYTSSSWQKIWSHGYISIESVTAKSCNYVARYVLKKQSQIDDDGVQSPDTRIRCFNTSSRKPGLGMLAIERLVRDGKIQITHVDSTGDRVIRLPAKAVSRLGERYARTCDFVGKAKCDALRHGNQLRAQQSVVDAVGNQVYADYLLDVKLERQRSLRCLPERM